VPDVSIISTASILPEKTVSNVEIGEKLIAGVMVDDEPAADIVSQTRTRSELIEKKTGLKSRRFFAEDAKPAEVGFTLLERLMDRSSWSDLDAIIVSSSSTMGFPGLSQQMVAMARDRHSALGDPFVLDINSNACTSFMYALQIGAAQIRGMGFRKVACIAIEFSSRCIAYDPVAFGTSTLFGDAVAGALLEAGHEGIAIVEEVKASSMVNDETIALIKGGGVMAATPQNPVPRDVRWFMAGPPVAIGATKILVGEIKRYQEEGHAIDWLIPHQANLTRILIPACQKVGIDPSKLCASFTETGNTSSASIPLLLDQLARSDKVRKDQKALLIGFGASFSMGSALLRFTGNRQD
jgi:3-oxoacyl-[acyl-carrier-protein] synthase-3